MTTSTEPSTEHGKALEIARAERHRHDFGLGDVSKPLTAFCRCGAVFLLGELTLMHQWELHVEACVIASLAKSGCFPALPDNTEGYE